MTPATIFRTKAGVYWLFGLTGVDSPGMLVFLLEDVSKLHVFTVEQLNERA